MAPPVPSAVAKTVDMLASVAEFFSAGQKSLFANNSPYQRVENASIGKLRKRLSEKENTISVAMGM